MVPAQGQYLVAIERERSTEAQLHGPRGGTRVQRQLESPVPDLPDVRDIVVEAGEVREEFVVEQVACGLVVRVCGETDPVIEQAEIEAQVVLRSEEHTSELQSLTNLVCR